MQLLDALAKLFPESSKTTLRSWVVQGRVWVDDISATDSRQMVADNARVHLGPRKKFIPSRVVSRGVASRKVASHRVVNRGVAILYEDADLVVVDKPEGLLSVAAAFEKEETLHALLKMHKHAPRVFVVHRLDRETSGVMLFAYSERAKNALKRDFELHTIERRYVAIVEGEVAGERGVWQSLLSEDKNYVVRSTAHGRLAITHYEVLARQAGYTFLALELKTGRKNQIRVHASEAGHPVAGDTKYGARKNPLGRLVLHAHTLAFTHPTSGKKLSFLSAIPETFFRPPFSQQALRSSCR